MAANNLTCRLRAQIRTEAGEKARVAGGCSQWKEWKELRVERVESRTIGPVFGPKMGEKRSCAAVLLLCAANFAAQVWLPNLCGRTATARVSLPALRSGRETH